MKKFSARILIFALPYGFLFAFSGWILFASSEILSYNEILAYQKSNANPSLVGHAYSYSIKSYKLHRTQATKPNILALGSSRVMQLRTGFFKEENTFYNAGGAVNKIRFFRLFLDQLDQKTQPELIIIGLDQWWFNPNWDDLKKGQFDSDLLYPTGNARLVVDHWRTVYEDWGEGKIDVSKLITPPDSVARFGLSAIMQNHGFRRDGSYYYGNFNYQNTVEQNFVRANRMLNNGVERFIKCDSVNPAAINELNLFLDLCKERKIKVVGYLPPFGKEIIEGMRKEEKAYPYIFRLEEKVSGLFADHGYGFFNFTDATTYGGDDTEFINGTHGSEKIYLRMFIKMVEQNEVLKKYVDLELLKSILREAQDRTEVFGFNNKWTTAGK